MFELITDEPMAMSVMATFETQPVVDSPPQTKVFSEHSKELVQAADMFGIGNLKVEAEGWYVDSTSITLENFVENLEFADAKKCALLKERVMDFLVRNEERVLDRLMAARSNAGGGGGGSGSGGVPQTESMLTDFLTALARSKRPLEDDSDDDDDDYDVKTMPINKMRRMLDERGLDVDGTREMLVGELERHLRCMIVVEGAGIPEINGRYARRGSNDGVPMYRMNAAYDGSDVEFTLFRCKLTDNSRRWYISIVPPNARPGTSRDVDYYTAVPDTKGGDGPPTERWMCIPGGAAARSSSAPTVRFA